MKKNCTSCALCSAWDVLSLDNSIRGPVSSMNEWDVCSRPAYASRSSSPSSMACDLLQCGLYGEKGSREEGLTVDT